MSVVGSMISLVMSTRGAVYPLSEKGKTAERRRVEDRGSCPAAVRKIAFKIKLAPEGCGRRTEAKGQAKLVGGFLRYSLALAAVLAIGVVCGWPVGVAPPPSISSVAWSPDGKRLVTGSDDGTAKVWDAKTGKELLKLSLRGSVLSIAWSPDGKRLATASADNTASVWDAETGKKSLNLDFVGFVRSVTWSPDGKRLATGAVRNPVRVWDAVTGKELLSLDRLEAMSIAWSPNGKRLATGGGPVKVWDAETGKQLLNLGGLQVVSVAWSPDGKRLAMGCGNGTAKVWDAETGKELLTLSAVWTVTWSPDGKRLATGSQDATAKVWDARTGEKLLTLGSRRGGVFSVAWSPNGRRLATGSDCNTTKVWDAETGKGLLTLGGFPTTFRGCDEGASVPGGPTVTLGIEINLPSGGAWPVAVGADHAVFYVPAVGTGEVLGVIAVAQERFVGIRITPTMGPDSVKIAVSALVKAKKNLLDATCNEIRSWQSVDAGSYEGKKDESLLLTGLGQLGLPVFHVRVVRVHGPPPGGFHRPYANFSAHCDCDATRDAANAWLGFVRYPDAGKCVEIGKCGLCCRIFPGAALDSNPPKPSAAAGAGALGGLKRIHSAAF